LVVLGCCCARHFPRAAALYRSLARVICDFSNPLTTEAVKWAAGRGFLTEWEVCFSLDTRGRKLTGRQLYKRVEVHRSLLSRMAVAGRGERHA
jgi:hypothetical protein